MFDEQGIRAQLVRLLDFAEAHVGFDRAVTGMPLKLAGKLPPGAEHRQDVG